MFTENEFRYRPYTLFKNEPKMSHEPKFKMQINNLVENNSRKPR